MFKAALSFSLLTLIFASAAQADTATSPDALSEAEFQQMQADNQAFALSLAQKYKDIAILSSEARENQNLICAEGTYTTEIVRSVSLALSNAYLADATNLTVFKSYMTEFSNNKSVMKTVGDNFTFRKYVVSGSAYADSLETVAKALVGTKLWGVGQGVYGSQTEVTFVNDSEAVLGTMEILNQEPWTKWTYKTVKYSVGQNASGDYVITIDGQKLIMRINYQYDNQTELVPENDPSVIVPVFVEYPSECEA